ncbi:uncharacterized protein [Nicotiana tomentosiformis]|uniref:uncharacterized protein isoform X2 n=1 Tax=Nicotiana tomentosiformis TaxID=4098 RepID=UPI00388CA1F7
MECQDQDNLKETSVIDIICKSGVQSQDLENPLGTSISKIVCKCVEKIYDLSTPLSLKEKFGNQNDANQESFETARKEDGVDYHDDEISKERSGGQSQDIENTQGTSISKIVCKCIEGTYDISTPLSLTDNIGSQKNASQDNDLTGMILTVAKEQNKNEAVNQYTRKRKRDSIGFDGPSFAILTPTPPTTQMSIDEGLSMEVEGNVEEELGRGKRNKKLSWQLKSPFEQKRKRGTSMAHNENTPKYTGWIKSKYTRTCIFYYAKDDKNLLKKFIGWLGKEKWKGRKKVGQTDIYAEDNGVRKNPYKLYHQKISRKMFFLELADSSFVLDDKHIDIALYYLRKKECYHPCAHPFRCTTTDILFDNYMLIVYKDFNEDASDLFWCDDNQLVLTPYVWGDNRRCGIAWTEVDKIFFPCRLPSEDNDVVTHFLLGVLDLNERKIDVYDSIYSEPYEQGMKHIEMYARMIPHLLKFSQFEKNHKSFGNAFNKFDIQWQRSPHQTGSTDCGAFLIKYVELLMMEKDVEKFQPEDISNFRKELAANLWAHGEWKKNSGYDTPPENVGDDYDSENETSCLKEL